MSGKEYNCDRCEEYVPDGSGMYWEDDRLCSECYDKVGDEQYCAIMDSTDERK